MRIYMSTARKGKPQDEGATHSTNIQGRRLSMVWNTEVETLKDKLEPWWRGPGELIQPISNLVWEVRGPEGKLWVRHTDMI